MKTIFLTILIITALFGADTALAAVCPANGYCYTLAPDNKPDETSKLAAIFSPKDPPEKIFASLFNFLLGFVGIGAMVMIVIEGIKYMTSGGDQSKIGEAKRKIWNAVWGLILALISFLLLQTINPDLAEPPGLKTINLQRQEGLDAPTNESVSRCLYNQNAADCEKLKRDKCSKPVSYNEDHVCYCIQNPGGGLCSTTGGL